MYKTNSEKCTEPISPLNALRAHEQRHSSPLASFPHPEPSMTTHGIEYPVLFG